MRTRNARSCSITTPHIPQDRRRFPACRCRNEPALLVLLRLVRVHSASHVTLIFPRGIRPQPIGPIFDQPRNRVPRDFPPQPGHREFSFAESYLSLSRSCAIFEQFNAQNKELPTGPDRLRCGCIPKTRGRGRLHGPSVGRGLNRRDPEAVLGGRSLRKRWNTMNRTVSRATL